MALKSTNIPNSLWLETAPSASSGNALCGDKKYEVVIVGAGFTGLRAALKLAEAGLNVAVVDAGELGSGASGRTGGQVNPMLPFVSPEQLLKLVGPVYFERLTKISLGSANELFELIKHYQIDCQARQHGWLRVDHCGKAQNISRETAQNWNGYGANMKCLEGPELHKLTGTTAYQSGILSRDGGAVQPMMLVQGLAKAAISAGAQAYWNSRVTKLERLPSGWNIHTELGSISSKWVVLATNGYSDKLLPGLANSIIPIVPIQVATEPLTDEQIGSILPNGHTISDTRRIIMYARREPDNRMVFGSLGKQKLNGQITGHQWLKRDAERIYPSLRGVHWKYLWSGKIALTGDRLPHFHEPAEGLIAGLGYNGRGVAMSHVMGRVLADRILGTAAEDLPFPSTSIEKVPFRGIQMLGMRSAVSWMKLLDRIEISI